MAVWSQSVAHNSERPRDCHKAPRAMDDLALMCSKLRCHMYLEFEPCDQQLYSTNMSVNGRQWH